MNLLRKLLVHIKNIHGWRTNRKIVVFSVDDYGNIRIANREARERMRQAGLDVCKTRFDMYDSLEDKNDLADLFETLRSVKDANGNHPVFTLMTNPANPDFERIEEYNFKEYYYELLPDIYRKLPGYEGTWELWKEGIAQRFIFPQFHGREHLNVSFFMNSLRGCNQEVLAAFKNRSFGAISGNFQYTAAFNFDDFSEIEVLKNILVDGLNVFEKVFGFRARHFAAPGARESSVFERTMFENGIEYIDKDFISREPIGRGRYKRKLYYNGQKNEFGQIYIVRNCLFEPVQTSLYTNVDWLSQCLRQIDIAFKWGKPANISGHRVNYSGHIDPAVREKGLSMLKMLLKEIIKRWPGVEFMTTVELGDLIRNSVIE